MRGLRTIGALVAWTVAGGLGALVFLGLAAPLRLSATPECASVAGDAQRALGLPWSAAGFVAAGWAAILVTSRFGSRVRGSSPAATAMTRFGGRRRQRGDL